MIDTIGAMESCRREMATSHAKFGSYTSAHEAYGVLSEEVAELLDEIRANNACGIQEEALQVAAVALRLAMEITNNAAMRKRSGVE